MLARSKAQRTVAVIRICHTRLVIVPIFTVGDLYVALFPPASFKCEQSIPCLPARFIRLPGSAIRGVQTKISCAGIDLPYKEIEHR